VSGVSTGPELQIAMGRRARDLKAQSAALACLARGVAVPGEVARLAGVSRQLVEQWARSAGIDWRAARAHALGKEWRKHVRGERPAIRKAVLRRQAAKAKRQWDGRDAKLSAVGDVRDGELPVRASGAGCACEGQDAR
jgi:hypothetical protein